MTKELQWQDITMRDPFLAGTIATHERQWWDETTAEQEAEIVGLPGEQRVDFLSENGKG